MSTLYAFSLGPLAVTRPDGALYVGALDDRFVGPARTQDPEAALAELRGQVPEGTPLRCAPELATVGIKVGYTPEPLPDWVARMRAVLAISFCHVEMAPDAKRELAQIARAAGRYWATSPWVRLPNDKPLTLVVRGERARAWEVMVFGLSTENIGVGLFPLPGSMAQVAEAMARGQPELASLVDGVSVTFREGPEFAMRVVSAWPGLERVPLLFALEGGKERACNREEVLALAVAMEALANAKLGDTVSRGALPEVGVAAELGLAPGAVEAPKRPARTRRPRRG